MFNAYCEEMNAIVTIEEVVAYYFSEPEPEKRKRLKFLCSDPNCNVPIKGVNYSNEIYKKIPHFSRIGKHKHIDNCIWNYLDEILENINNGNFNQRELGNSNLFRTFENADPKDIVDEYCPIINRNINPNNIRQNNNINRNNVYQWARNYRHKTSLFGKLIASYNSLTNDEKTTTFIRIPTENGTEQLSYNDAFINIENININNQPQRIFYGEAKVYKYGENIFKIIFKQANKNVPAYERWLSVVTIIDTDEIDNETPFGNRFKKSLNNVFKEKSHLFCYILGNAILGEAELKLGSLTPCLIVQPLSFSEIEFIC